MTDETFGNCPSCGAPGCSFVNYTECESPKEVFCKTCKFDWQESRGNHSPDRDAQEYREGLECDIIEDMARVVDALYGKRRKMKRWRMKGWIGNLLPRKRYRCSECGEICSKQEGCLCDSCGEILLADANREMFGDEADWMEIVGMTDFGDK
ncbi:MAG: hypothetical protein NWE89_00660 [Candidatus Bathyarchaeota archaeon]|nr:hypothetical protein [Candidatus Bathyarchaeota archaeon]